MIINLMFATIGAIVSIVCTVKYGQYKYDQGWIDCNRTKIINSIHQFSFHNDKEA